MTGFLHLGLLLAPHVSQKRVSSLFPDDLSWANPFHIKDSLGVEGEINLAGMILPRIYLWKTSIWKRGEVGKCWNFQRRNRTKSNEGHLLDFFQRDDGSLECRSALTFSAKGPFKINQYKTMMFCADVEEASRKELHMLQNSVLF